MDDITLKEQLELMRRSERRLGESRAYKMIAQRIADDIEVVRRDNEPHAEIIAEFLTPLVSELLNRQSRLMTDVLTDLHPELMRALETTDKTPAPE